MDNSEFVSKVTDTLNEFNSKIHKNEQLLVKSVSYIVNKTDDATAAIEELRQLISDNNKDVNNKVSSVSKQETEDVRQLNSNISEINKKLVSLTNSLTQLSTTLTNTQAKLTLLQEDLDSLKPKKKVKTENKLLIKLKTTRQSISNLLDKQKKSIKLFFRLRRIAISNCLNKSKINKLKRDKLIWELNLLKRQEEERKAKEERDKQLAAVEAEKQRQNALKTRRKTNGQILDILNKKR